MTTTTLPFNNLHPLHESLAKELHEATQRVLRSGWFILGPEVEAFEAEFAKWHGAAHSVGVANGTDAIELALRAGGIGPGDEVITVSHTAVATVCAIERTGATPVLVDVDPESFTMSPAAARAAVTSRTRAIVPVHLYGHPADMTSLMALAEEKKLFLVEDCAQAHGATWQGRKVGTMGHAASFSFYPTKNLGALGDGGAVVTSDAQLAARIKKLRNYGQVTRYLHEERGMNSRLDEMQAALLRAKLPHLDAHNATRVKLAAAYAQGLPSTVKGPTARAEARHVFHLYVVRHPRRDALQEALQKRGTGTLIHYPKPVHLQPAYASLGMKPGSLPTTEKLASEILSLPLWVGLTTEQVQLVCTQLGELA